MLILEENIVMKQHSKEYLIELANNNGTPDWLRLLISKAIETNGDVSLADMTTIYSMLKNEDCTKIPLLAITSTEMEHNKILLKKLIHHKGVCALKEEQKIHFSNEITILYGLNGTGKSSYFKILNEIVGGNQKKEIKGNIYKDIATQVDTEINFIEPNGNENIIHWYNQSRSIAPLNCIRVFDSSYLNGLLNKRSTDETLVNPYGLHLFSYISEKLDELKQKIEIERINELSQQPNIDITHLNERYKEMFSSKKINERYKCDIEKLYVYSNEIDNIIEEKVRTIKDIEQVNLEDKIQLEKINIENFTQLKKKVHDYNNWVIQSLSEIKDLIYSLQFYKYESIKVKDKLSILNEIGNTDSDSWKAFIKAGNKYLIDSSFHDEDRCPYCRQLLDKNALNIIKAYGIFINDDTEKMLSSLKLKINNQKIKINGFSVNLSISENIKNILIHNEDDNFLYMIENLEMHYNSIKQMMLHLLDKNAIDCNIYLHTENVVEKLEGYITNSENIIKGYQSDREKRNERISKLKDEIAPLQEHKYISEHKDDFLKWFTHCSMAEKLIKIEKKINTKNISDLANKAYNELITDNLRLKFEEELIKIGFSNLKVVLESAGTKKGNSSMKMKLERFDDVTAVLSEGEQKGVGLALFIAEAKMQQTSNPIIFDDPVNSLDHRIAAQLAERLLSLDNQLIIFTHNKLFLDAFECSNDAHICKNMNGGCNKNKGKHIFLYHVLSESKMLKGIITPKNEDSSQSYINEAKKKLQKSPFTESLEVSANLRYAIERIIDEVVFNHQIPTKMSNKNSRISWDDLIKMNNDPILINKLKSYHSRLSGGCLHNGAEEGENSIEKEEFENIINYLESILR